MQAAPKSTRIAALDILRGIAILGTLGTNIWVFSAAGTPLVEAFTHTRITIQSLFEVFCNGKFLSLLAILFGVGVAIQFDSSQRKGQHWPGHYLWRSTLLFLEGLLHFTLLFEGDVLMGYAVAAVIVAFTLRGGERLLSWVMAIAGGLHLLFVTLVVVALTTAPAAEVSTDPLSDYASLLLHGSYLEQVAYRLNHPLLLRAEPLFALPYTVFLFCLGVWLYRRGAFHVGEGMNTLQQRMLAWGLGLGLPLNALVLVPALLPELGTGSEILLFFAVRYGCSAVLALGYTGLVMWLICRNAHGWLWNRLSAIGRTALSTYVSQSLMLSLVFYGWGLGLGSQQADWADLMVALLFIGLCMLHMGIAEWWIRRGGGPLERIRKRLERLGQPPAP
jgi:uncharacterized protein